MAFGRHREHPRDPSLDEVRKAIAGVAALGLTIVASAGNDGSTEPVYPAAFAVDDDLSSSMVSVGLPPVRARVGPVQQPRALGP